MSMQTKYVGYEQILVPTEKGNDQSLHTAESQSLSLHTSDETVNPSESSSSDKGRWLAHRNSANGWAIRQKSRRTVVATTNLEGLTVHRKTNTEPTSIEQFKIVRVEDGNRLNL